MLSPKRSAIIAPLAGNSQAEGEVSAMVGQCYETLRVYGKEPGQIKTIVRTFLMLLGEYPLLRVRAAFLGWMKTHNEMPTPADIIGIIEGDSDEWKFVFSCLDQFKNGGSVAEFVWPRLEKALGKNWREYV